MIFTLSAYTAKRLAMLLFAGIIIHLLQHRDVWLMLILALSTVYIYFKKRKSESANLYFLGFLISATGGVLAENWGISTGLWKYHDLPHGREFPYWLPFAWGLAFSFLYSCETYFIKILQIETLQGKLLLTMIASLVLPVFGEIVTVYLGVWTYYGNFKILGIPLYAMGLLVLFHTGTFLLLTIINSYWKISDPVFSISSFKKGCSDFKKNSI